jgi:hypothetical protein
MAKTDSSLAAKARKAERDKNRAVRKVLGGDNMAAGAWMADKFFSPGSLGRASTGIQMTKNEKGEDVPMVDANGNPVRIQENQDTLNRYNDLSKGLSAEQYQAAREQQMKGMQSGLATQMGQLAKAQARGKVYGAAGAAQQANALQGYENSVADIEQQSKLKDVELIREGTDKYAGQLASLQKFEREGEQYNLAQRAGEIAGAAGAYTNTIAAAQGNKLTKEGLNIAKQALNESRSGRSSRGGSKEPDVTPKPGSTSTNTTPPAGVTTGNVNRYSGSVNPAEAVGNIKWFNGSSDLARQAAIKRKATRDAAR